MPFITETELKQQILMLKKTLDESKIQLKNVTFLNNDLLYSFLKQLYCSNGETVETVLNNIEHCISPPLKNDIASLCSLLPEEERENFSQRYLQSAKNDFLLLLSSISEKEVLEDVLNNCEQLRQQNDYKNMTRKEKT